MFDTFDAIRAIIKEAISRGLYKLFEVLPSENINFFDILLNVARSIAIRERLLPL